MSEKTLVRDLTQGSIVRSLLTYAAPLFVANALQAVYNVVDMMVVGQVEGGLGMAAVSIGGDIIHLVTFLLIGFTGAGQIILSQFVGAQKKEEIKKMIGTMFVVTFSLSILMFALCMIFGETFMKLINADPQAMGPAKAYYVTGICGVFFIAGYNCICSILRGMGDSKHPLYFIGIASILNIILDILFVAGFHWSTFGASLATVLGQSVSFFIGLRFLYKHKEEFGFDFRRSSFKVHKEVFRPLVKLGIPMSIQMAAITLSKTVLAAWINDQGWVYTALAGVYNKLSMFIG
ncbi:MAG: MATE family efflux transporter, partial [Firmicutes bacterium]|nr:MATE family efflux transporter [Bacillota bacterium]